MPIQRWENEGGRVLGLAAKVSPSVRITQHMHVRRDLMASAHLFKTRIELPVDRRKKLIALLNQHVADTFDLYGQAKQAHWNVKGPQFYQLHELFDELADQVRNYVDLIAERATALGGTALGTVRMSAEASRLDEYPRNATDGLQHVEAQLGERARELNDHARIGRQVAAADDAADGAFAPDQHRLDITAVLARHEIGYEAGPAGKIDRADMIARVVEQMPRRIVRRFQRRCDQRKIVRAQRAQHFQLFVTHRIRVAARGRLHGQMQTSCRRGFCTMSRKAPVCS